MSVKKNNDKKQKKQAPQGIPPVGPLNQPVVRQETRFESLVARAESRKTEIITAFKTLDITPKFANYYDFGCADGFITTIMGTLFMAKQISGGDITELIGQKLLDHFVKLDKENTIVENKGYDCITAFSTFHHTSDWRECVRQVCRAVRRGGFVIVREHDVHPLNDDVVRILGEEHVRHGDNSPVTYFTNKQLLDEFASQGLMHVYNTLVKKSNMTYLTIFYRGVLDKALNKESEFTGPHPRRVHEKYIFGKNAKETLYKEFQHLSVGLELKGSEPHPHPYAAFARKHFSKAIFLGCVPAGNILDIGAHLMRNSTMIDNDGGLINRRVWSTYPLIDSRDAVRHQHWNHMGNGRQINVDIPMAGCLGQCKCVANIDGACTCYGDLKFRAFSAIDSVYYDGVIQGLVRELQHHSSSNAAGYLAFHDYTGVKIGYELPDREGVVSVDTSGQYPMVSVQMHGNPFAYEHRIVQTKGDQWYWPVNGTHVLCEVIRSLPFNKHRYILVRCQIQINLIPGIPVIDFYQTEKKDIKQAIEIMTNIPSHWIPQIQKDASVAEVTVNEKNESLLIRWIGDAGPPCEVFVKDINRIVIDATKNGGADLGACVAVARRIGIEETAKGISLSGPRYSSLRHAARLATLVHAHEFLSDEYVKKEEVYQSQIAVKAGRDIDTIYGLRCCRKRVPLTLGRFTKLTKRYEFIDKILTALSFLKITALLLLTVMLFAGVAYLLDVASQTDNFQHALTVIQNSTNVNLTRGFLPSAYAQETLLTTPQSIDWTWQLLVVLAFAWLIRKCFRKRKQHTINAGIQIQQNMLYGSCVLDNSRIDPAIVNEQSKFKVRDPELKNLMNCPSGQAVRDYIPCDCKRDVYGVQISPIIVGNIERRPVIKHSCKLTQISSSFRACSNRVQPDPKVLKIWRPILTEIFDCLIALSQADPVIVDYAVWLSKYDQEYRDLAMKMEFDYRSGIRKWTYEGFPKIEKQFTYKEYIPGSPDPEPKERMICGPDMLKKLCANAFVNQMERLSEGLGDDGYPPWYCGSKNWDEIGYDMGEIENFVGEESIWVAADGSGFDMTQHRPILEAFAEELKRFLACGNVIWKDGNPEDVNAAFDASNILKVDIIRGAICYITEGTRASGDGWTTWANTVLNISYWKFISVYMKMRLLGKFKGDDSIQCIPVRRQKEFDLVTSMFFTKSKDPQTFGLGQICKTLTYGPLESLEFLSSRFIHMFSPQKGYHYRMVRIPARLFQLTSWTTKIGPNEKMEKVRELCWSNGMCVLAWATGLPIFEAYGRMLLRVANYSPRKGQTPRLEYGEFERVYHLDAMNASELARYREDAAVWFSMQFKLDYDDINGIERAFDSIREIYQVVKIPAIEKLYDI